MYFISTRHVRNKQGEASTTTWHYNRHIRSASSKHWLVRPVIPLYALNKALLNGVIIEALEVLISASSKMIVHT